MNSKVTALSSLVVTMAQATQSATPITANMQAKQEEFHNFCEQNHKVYTTTSEYTTHLAQYTENQGRIAAKNAKHTGAHFGNDFGADLSAQETKEQMFGAVLEGMDDNSPNQS